MSAARREAPEALPDEEVRRNGGWLQATVVTDYFGLETRTKALPVRWRAKRPQNASLLRNRQRLAELRESFGLCYIGRQFVAE